MSSSQSHSSPSAASNHPTRHRPTLTLSLPCRQPLSPPISPTTSARSTKPEPDHPNLIKYPVNLGSLSGAHVPEEASLSNISRQILSALSYLHSMRIVHHYINPSSILIDSGNIIKLADSGVARDLSSLLYYSPERITTDFGVIYNGYSGDIWSFGMSILEVYIGRCPIAVEQEGCQGSMVSAICGLVSPRAPTSASAEFQDFISCCLQRDPGQRWGAEQLLEHPFILRHSTQQG